MHFHKVTDDSDYGLSLSIINTSFLTVADDLSLTLENCPANPAFMDIVKLRKAHNDKTEYFLLYEKDMAVGFVAIEESSGSDIRFYIEKLAVLPEFRHCKYGENLMSFAEHRIAQRGGKEISLGTIHENLRLKNWYKSLGYKENGLKEFDHLPFTVCFMHKALT